MPFASYPDQPHHGLPIPMWAIIVATLLSVVLAVVAQARNPGAVKPLGEPMMVPAPHG